MLVDCCDDGRVNDIAFPEELLQERLILVLVDTLRHMLFLLF